MSDYSEDPLELPEVTYDYLLKLICIGESGTGKTCLLHHYLNQDFRANAPHTIGVSFASTVLKLPSTLSPASSSALVGRGRKGSLVQPPIRSLKLQIWDTAGQERFRSVTRNYYRGAIGLILCYDITRRSTFDHLQSWLDDARALGAPHLAGVLVGNFLDLEEQREVGWEEGERWAQERGLTFIEVSSLTGENVNQPFYTVGRAVLSAVESGAIDPEAPNSGVAFGERTLKRASSWTALRRPSRYTQVTSSCGCS